MNPVQFYKCLADETRLRCLMLIEHENELCVCELTEALQEIQPKISRHLAQLRQCQLLLDRRQGQWIFYRINPSIPDWAKSVLTQTTEANMVFLKENMKNLRRMGDRPERARACCEK
ncbi:MAG: metalloregulator ArsR/SmtB family transcription factor [Pseudomonadales bacterium]|nr:metalloregulator ArsR/SmtB family transcription factor [Pseudomonadales bacterium]MCP5215383.1 metalloregulator ArsR/SmtB family transcription factor [Pseudomonadales bacterium]